MGDDVQEINLFAVKSKVNNLPCSELFFQNRTTSIIVDGLILEKQYLIEKKYLLFLTEDCPFEEWLHIYLLDQNLQILDAVELGAPYTPGILSDVVIESNGGITFCFFKNDRWRLYLTSKTGRRWNISLFSPIKYKKGLYSNRWLTIEKITN